MKQKQFVLTACAIAACVALSDAWAQDAAAASSIVVTGKRVHRISSGATGLPMDIKDTPQSISTIDADEIADFGITGSIDALRLGTGINVDQYETNRSIFNARGFQVQLTQIDGLGVSNDWGTVVGQQDAYLFERIELIRGANGLLTGVGNASGTINYVRKRPKNKDGGEVEVTVGSYDLRRVAFDYNKVLAADGSWAGRVVVTHEDKDSHLRALHDRRSTLYAVVDGQIGDNGVLTLGVTHQDSKQRSPMWGSLTVNYAGGRFADFDASSSTSQDWTRWNTRTTEAFAEYVHRLGNDWEAKATLTRRDGDETTKLFYAYVDFFDAPLNDDNTGLNGWPYRSIGTTSSAVADVNLSGKFQAFGRRHSLIVGLNYATQKHDSDYYAVAAFPPPLPAFPYAGNVVPEPDWGARTDSSDGRQRLTRLYAATRLSVASGLNAILGVNAIRLHREGASRYGSGGVVTDPDTDEVSPYLGLTYDITPNLLAYGSYSDIFQAQDQSGKDGLPLAPMRGVNTEAGVKAEWLDKKLLTTFAIFTAKQSGLATAAGSTASGQFYSVPKDVKSRGFEFEATGRITRDARVTAGLTRLKLTGPDGNDIYEWVPRTTVNLRADTRIAALPALRLGVGARWQSDVSRKGPASGAVVARQDDYLYASAFASYAVSDAATVRLNVNNLTDKKYLHGLSNGALYGAPRNAALTLEYKL